MNLHQSMIVLHFPRSSGQVAVQNLPCKVVRELTLARKEESKKTEAERIAFHRFSAAALLDKRRHYQDSRVHIDAEMA